MFLKGNPGSQQTWRKGEKFYQEPGGNQCWWRHDGQGFSFSTAKEKAAHSASTENSRDRSEKYKEHLQEPEIPLIHSYLQNTEGFMRKPRAYLCSLQHQVQQSGYENNPNIRQWVNAKTNCDIYKYMGKMEYDAAILK